MPHIRRARSRPAPATLKRILPLANRLEALTRKSGRAFVERDVQLARSLLSPDGEHAQMASAFEAVWCELLGAGGFAEPKDVPAAAGLVSSLHAIADLAAVICDRVIRLSSHPVHDAQPSIEQLAELVPDMLGDALGALSSDDRRGAERVVADGLIADTYFAKTHLDLLQVIRAAGGTATALELHGVTSALERIGDRASEIAASVGRPESPAAA